MHDDHFDALETRDPQQRAADLAVQLPMLIAHARTQAPAYVERLRGIDSAAVTSLAALAALPVTRKQALMQAQRDALSGLPAGSCFGGFAAVGWGAAAASPTRQARRVYASPGPIYEVDGHGLDPWRMARALYAAGFRAGQLLHNSFSHHFTPAGAMFEDGAHAVGCTTFPAGTGQTEQQVQAIAELRPDGYAGTPSFLKIILERADALGVALPSLRRALLSGEALPAALRDGWASRGIDAYQCYASADLGLIAYETQPRDGLVVDEGVIVEIVRPGSGDVVPEGEVGEVVVTTTSPAYPLIRFGTGDLSAVLPGACPSGRTAMRLRGWLGRADQSAKVRGLFVHPAQVADVLRGLPDAIKARLVVAGMLAEDRLTLHVEVADPAPPGLSARLAERLRDVTKLRGEVTICAPGSLPNDGRVIDDVRADTRPAAAPAAAPGEPRGQAG